MPMILCIAQLADLQEALQRPPAQKSIPQVIKTLDGGVLRAVALMRALVSGIITDINYINQCVSLIYIPCASVVRLAVVYGLSHQNQKYPIIIMCQ